MPNSSSLAIEQVLTLLAATPPRIAGLAAGSSPAQLHSAPNQDEWSANDVLAHLRACADMWGTCMMAILAQDRPTLRAVNPRTWITHARSTTGACCGRETGRHKQSATSEVVGARLHEIV